MGRLGSFNPARALLTAFATVFMASSWPIIRWCRASSICRRRLVSSIVSLITGMPVHMLTTSAISSEVTTGRPCSFLTCHSFSIVSILSVSWSSRSRNSPEYSYCWAAIAVSFSLRTLSKARLASANPIGALPRLMRTRELASSIKSIALSGKKRSAIYLVANVDAVCRASSLMSNWWNSSYLCLMPRSISSVSSMVGSATKTGWNRRSNAGSFSTYLR